MFFVKAEKMNGEIEKCKQATKYHHVCKIMLCEMYQMLLLFLHELSSFFYIIEKSFVSLSFWLSDVLRSFLFLHNREKFCVFIFLVL